MFNLSIPDLIVVGAAGLIVFGPKRLPELARSVGESVRELKKAMEGEPKAGLTLALGEANPQESNQDRNPPLPEQAK